MSEAVRKIVKVDPNSGNECDALLYERYTKIRSGYVLVGPDNVCLSSRYEQLVSDIENFQVHSDDIWVMGYPKSGTNWLQEIVWCIGNDLNYEQAKSKVLNARFPTLEFPLYFDPELVPEAQKKGLEFISDTLKYCEDSLPRPRFIKSHLPWSVLPKDIFVKKPKIIYIVRKPKDIIGSYYNHLRILERFSGDINDVVTLLTNDRLLYTPYFKHVEDFWNVSKNSDSNVLFIKFEDLKSNTRDTIIQVAKFLNKNFTDREIDGLIEHTNFEQMKKNPAVNRKELFKLNEKDEFLRSGKSGSYKNELSDEMIEQLNDWISKNTKTDEMKFLV